MQLAELQTVNAERAARRAVLVVTDIKGGAPRVVKAADVAADPLKEVLQ
ncbi:MAG: XdhC family protein, partial [Pseudolabrys sp.]